MEQNNKKIYSKSGADWCNLFSVPIVKMSDDQIYLDSPQYFIHGVFDLYKEDIHFIDALNEDQWNNLQRFNNSVLLHENQSETFQIDYIAGQIKDIVEKKKINPNQIYILLVDELHVEALSVELFLKDITGINIDFYNKWLVETPIPQLEVKTTIKKFSAFSRRFHGDRIQLFFELIKEDLLGKFNYSFNNIDPYTHKTYSLEEMQNEVRWDSNEYRDKLNGWLAGLPYRANNNSDYNNIHSDSLTEAMLSSDIHLIIETHYTKIQNHPIAWLTEKTWRPIVCKKPFLTYSTPGALSYIRKSGFKTFSPYIDESYDGIADNTHRRNAVVKEIKRISQLPDNEYQQLVNNCKIATEHNFQLLLEKKQRRLSVPFRNLGIFK